MSTTEIRTTDTDKYIVLSQYNSSDNLEIAIAQTLVQSAYAQTIIDTSSGIYTSPANDSSWNCVSINDTNPDYINTSAISHYPSKTVTEYSVISSEFLQDLSVNLYTTNISDNLCLNNSYDFTSLNTSSAFYDANYVITQNLLADCSDNQTGTYVTATFDVDASNANIQYAMQSRWNTILGPYDGLTTVGQDPVSIQQDFSNNLNISFASKGTGATDASYESYWYDCNTLDGSLIPVLIDASYQPIENKLLVGDRDLSGVEFDSTDVGIFRIQRPLSIITTKVSLNGSDSIITTTDLKNIPLFNGYGEVPLTHDSSKNLLYIPGTMSRLEFENLFDTNVVATIADDWNFNIDISSNNGGYYLDGSNSLIHDLNNSNLLDNPYYMENYVSNEHSINLQASNVVIDLSNNGILSNANSIVVDLSNGETLDNLYAGVNGEIIIRTNTIDTRYTDLSNVDLIDSYYPEVYYPSDASATGYEQLNSEDMLNPYFAAMWQKVAQNSPNTDPSYWLKSSNNAIMSLYTSLNGISNNYYNTSDFDFSFNSSLFNDTDIQLWKITGLNNIILDPQSLFNDPSYTILENNFSSSGVITGLVDDLSYNNYRLLLTAKTKEDISLQDAVNDVSGWELLYIDSSATYLTSNSDQAYSLYSFPSQMINSNIFSYLNNGNSINYSYTYYTTQNTLNGVGSLSDYVDISYNFGGDTQVVTIHQSEITRVFNPLYTDISYVIVDPSSYTFTGVIYNTTMWELVYVISTNRYDAIFPAKFGPFDNIQLSVKDINQVGNYYAIRHKIKLSLAPQSALQYVTSSSITDLNSYIENISPVLGNSLQINGTLTYNDIKAFNSILQGTDNTDIWSDIGSTISMDTYYGLKNVNNIEGLAQIETIIQYSLHTSEMIELNVQNYYIPFIFDHTNTSFILESFSASDSTIGTDTSINSGSFLNNTSYLTLTDGYSSINSWQSTTYTLTIEQSNNGSTIFTAKDTNDDVVFYIKTLNYTIFLGTFFVSYIPKDYYRTEKLLGNSSEDSSYNEGFFSTNYSTGKIQLSSASLSGIYIENGSSNMTLNNNPILGGYQSFRIVGDYISINLVGPTSSPNALHELGISAYNSSSLLFQYIDPSNSSIYSAQFRFPKYRGYNSYTSNTYQYYTIVRDSTVVTFDVSGTSLLSALSDTLTSKMYYGELFNVNNLRNTSNELVANLGINSSFKYSIPPPGSILTYYVNVIGDDVTVGIANPNYIGDASNIDVPYNATPVVDPRLYTASMTLKDYGDNYIYTFSGLLSETNNLMAIRPSRVKLYNSSYPYNSFSYKIQVLSSLIPVYKAKNVNSDVTFNWFGNPVLKGSQDPYSPPSGDDWELYATYTPSEIYIINGVGGINIGKKVLYQNPNSDPIYKIVYIVSTPTYYKFEQISSDSCPIIPYNYDSEYIANRTERFMPFINTTSGELQTVFNPFAPTVSYTDISGNISNVLTDPTILNNITFNLYSTTIMTTACSTSTYDITRYGIIVPGTNLNVYKYIGFYSSTNSVNQTNLIWSGPVTSIPLTPNIDENALILRSRDISGGIYFSALQYPSDIGYTSGATGYEEVFKTDVSSTWYNVDFYLGNSAWFNNNNPITYFNINNNGINTTLYTVEDINDPLTQINKKRVFKYTSAYNVDIYTSSGFQTFNITFNSRSYCDFDIYMNNDISNNSFTSNSSESWKYNNLVNATVIPNVEIVWSLDASYTSNSYVSWAFGNSVTSANLLLELFNVQNNQSKWAYINLKPFMRYLNQFNVQVGSVAWDGTVITPLVNTRVISLANAITNPVLINKTHAIQQFSESTL